MLCGERTIWLIGIRLTLVPSSLSHGVVTFVPTFSSRKVQLSERAATPLSKMGLGFSYPVWNVSKCLVLSVPLKMLSVQVVQVKFMCLYGHTPPKCDVFCRSPFSLFIHSQKHILRFQVGDTKFLLLTIHGNKKTKVLIRLTKQKYGY